MDILAFAERAGWPLFSVQKVVLKLICGLPLDESVSFEVRFWGRNGLTSLTTDEAAYAGWLLETGRLNRIPKDACGRVVLSTGRRAGKGHLLRLLLAHAVYEQLDEPRHAPREEFSVISHRVRAAEDLFAGFTEIARSVPEMAARCANDGRDYLHFQRAQDIAEHGPWKGSQRQAKSSLAVVVRAGLPAAFRGRTCRMIVLDEFGAFPEASATDMRSVAERCTQGVKGGRSLVFGTPLGVGPTAFRHAHDLLFTTSQHGVALRVPTWAMNPTVSDEFIAEEYARDSEDFWAEWGGDFLDEVTFRVPSDQVSLVRDLVRSR